MIRRWLLVHHPELWATRVPGMLATGALLALLAAAWGLALPVDLREIPKPRPLFGWAAALSGLLTLYWTVAAGLGKDLGPMRRGATGWTGIWATALGLALLNSAPFLGAEAYEVHLRALVPRERLVEAGRAFGQVAGTPALLATRILLRDRGGPLESRLGGVLRSRKDPDLEGARRLLARWRSLPQEERTADRALRLSGEALGLGPALPRFAEVVGEFGPGLDAEFAPDRPETSLRSQTDLVAEENLYLLVDARDENPEPSHPGESPDVQLGYATVVLWLALLIPVSRAFGPVLAGSVAGGLAILWITLKLLVPLALADASEATQEGWEALLWLGLWVALAGLWGPVAAARRRTPRAVALFTAWVLLLPFVGSWILTALALPEDEVRSALACAGLLLPLALAPLLQAVLNRFRVAPEGEPSGRRLPLPDLGAALHPLHRWIATHAPSAREDRLAGILGSAAALTALVSAYAAGLPVSVAAPPSYEATITLPWLAGGLLTLFWAGLLSVDAAAEPVRSGAAGWPRLPVLAVALASLTAAPFVGSAVVDMRLRALLPVEQVRTDLARLEAIGENGRAQALGLLMSWREEPSPTPSRVKELSKALDYQVKEEHAVRAEAILREWAGAPLERRTWISAAEVLGRHGAWVGPRVPWQATLARYGGNAEAVLEETAGRQQTWFTSNRAATAAQRLGGAHGLSAAARPPSQDRDLLSSWLWVTMTALYWVAGVRAVGLRWMLVGGGLFAGIFLGLAFLSESGPEIAGMDPVVLVTQAFLAGSAACLGLSASLCFRRARTRGLSLLLAAGLLGLPFLPILVGTSWGIEEGGAVPFWFSLAGSAAILAASPALQALLNLYRAAPADGTA